MLKRELLLCLCTLLSIVFYSCKKDEAASYVGIYSGNYYGKYYEVGSYREEYADLLILVVTKDESMLYFNLIALDSNYTKMRYDNNTYITDTTIEKYTNLPDTVFSGSVKIDLIESSGYYTHSESTNGGEDGNDLTITFKNDSLSYSNDSYTADHGNVVMFYGKKQ